MVTLVRSCACDFSGLIGESQVCDPEKNPSVTIVVDSKESRYRKVSEIQSEDV